MEINTKELGDRIKAARIIDGVLIGQAKFLNQIDPNDELGLNQSALSAIELGKGRCSQEKLIELAQRAGIEVPYLTNGTGSEVQENLANGKTQETVVPRRTGIAPSRVAAFTEQVRPYPSNPVISALDHCAREIEALPDAAMRGLVVDVLLRLYVEPFLKEQKE